VDDIRTASPLYRMVFDLSDYFIAF